MKPLIGPHPLSAGYPPAWASAWGEDRYGPFVEIQVKDVVQVMRWIPPGTFTMGSPESEAGRYERETQHEVELTKGFWLGDTPCTQALWEAVTGEDPSHFKSPERPVEQVSWDECHKRFLEPLNGEEKSGFRLPTEAEWEWACRAGTTTATYAGDLEILGSNNAPVLHEIAWYGGNCGLDWDLSDEEGRAVGFSEMQFEESKRGGSRLVKKKKANAWGLHDMLGNVWEWCSDWYGDYPTEPVVDPDGPGAGSRRVRRGGSWSGDAWYVRAACRGWYHPGLSDYYLGFRLARGL